METQAVSSSTGGDGKLLIAYPVATRQVPIQWPEPARAGEGKWAYLAQSPRAVRFYPGSAPLFPTTSFLSRDTRVGSASPMPKITSPEPRSRVTEIKWIDEHALELRSRYPREWIAVEGEELVAHGMKLANVIAAAKAKDVQHPFVTTVPD